MQKPHSALANLLIIRKLKEVNHTPELPKKHHESFRMPSMRPPLPKGKR